MQSSRAPLCVFLAAFITFAVAFAALVTLLKPKLDERRAQEQSSAARSAARDERPVTASLAATASGPAAHPAPRTATLRAVGRVIDARGAPIAGATVQFTDPTTVVVASCTSDAQGRFDASFAPAADLNASAAAPGYQSSPPTPLAGGSALQQLGDLVLRDGGAVRVRVSSDASGALLDATVTLLPAGDEEAMPLAEANSAADGCALLRGIDCGSYRLRVDAPGHARAERNWRFDGVGRDGTGELVFVLLPLTSYVTGTASDSRQAAIDRGQVVARLVRPEPTSPQAWRAELEGDGSFRIGPLPRGTYEVELEVEGMVQQGHLYAEADGDPLEIVAGHGGALEGSFADEMPLSAAPTLTLWKLDSSGHAQPVEVGSAPVIDLAARTFRIDGVPPGRYVVRAVAEGYAPTRSEPIELELGVPHEPLQIEFGDGGTLSGTLVDHRAAPFAGARITVFEGTAPPPTALAAYFPRDARATATTLRDGEFAVQALAAGAHVLLLEVPGQPARSFGPIWIAEGIATTLPGLSIAGGAVLSLTLHDGAGAVAAGGRVRVTSSELHLDVTGIADEQGNLCLRGLPAGRYWLTPSDGSEPHEIELIAGEPARLELLHSAAR